MSDDVAQEDGRESTVRVIEAHEAAEHAVETLFERRPRVSSRGSFISSQSSMRSLAARATRPTR